MSDPREPHFGRTRHGLAVHQHAIDHLPAHSVYARLNMRVAVAVTRLVGSMSCAWIFCLLALLSLPAVLTEAFGLRFFPRWLVAAGLISLVAWIAQTFLQLVLLSVIMVGQNVQQAASDARAAKTFEDTERIVDALDLKTEGGLAEVLAAVRALGAALTAAPGGTASDRVDRGPDAAGTGVGSGDGALGGAEPPAAAAARQQGDAPADKPPRRRNRKADQGTAGGTGRQPG